ncbi:MAG: hypothetical protein ACM31G_06620 [Flavobacteriales bacterium]
MKKTTKLNAKETIEGLAKNKQYAKALDILRRFKIEGLSVTKSTLKKEFGLTPKEIEELNYIEVDNPYYKCAGPMRLYLKAEVEKINKTA